MSRLPPVCILAGGLGTRLGELARDRPKPLVEVAGEPFLWHQLRLLAANGACEIVLCVGHLGEQVERSVGSGRFGLRIAYSHDAPGLDGTLGAIRRARELLGERFLVLYGDTYLRLDYAAAAAAWQGSELPALMTVLRNEGRWEPSNAVYADGRVLAYDKRAPSAEMRWIDYGLVGLCAAALARVPAETTDLCDLLAQLARERLLCGFEASERFFEIGTPAGLAETDAFLSSRPGAPVERVPPVPGTGLSWQGLRYAVAGGTVTLFNISATTGLAVVVGLPFQVALIIGYTLSLTLHFTLQRFFVWAHSERYALSLHHQLRRYLLVAAAQYGLNAGAVLLLPSALGLSPEVVYLMVSVLFALIAFVLFRNSVFHH